MNPLPLRVLHVIPSVGPLRGGPSFAVRSMTAALAARGVSVEVATTDDNGPERLSVPYSQPVVDQGVRYYYFPLDASFYGMSFSLAMWLERNIRSYHLIHIHTVFSFCSTAASALAYRRRIPYIIRPAGILNRWGMIHRRPWLKRLSFAWIEKRILGRAAVVHYTSEQEREEATVLGVRTRFVIVANPIAIAPPRSAASPDGLRARYPELANCKVVLFLSRIDPKKGLELLLPAFAEILRQDSQTRLVIAGTGQSEYVKHLRKEAAALGIESAVYWPGFLEGSAKQNAFADADVFALPSYSENFGIAVVEAMGQGLPVVVSDQVGIHPEIARAEAGLVTSCSVSAVAGALLRVLSSPGERCAMGRNARALARTVFSPAAAAASLHRLYIDIHANHRFPFQSESLGDANGVSRKKGSRHA